MSSPRISFTGTLEMRLREWLTGHKDGHERGAVVLLRKLDRSARGLAQSIRFIAVEVIPMEGDWILESSKTHFRINMKKFPEIYHRCETENLELGFFHNHPSGFPNFSAADHQNELNILKGLSGCNGTEAYLLCGILCDGQWKARIRQGRAPDAVSVRHLSVLHETIEIHGVASTSGSENLDRQAVAFGKPFNDKVASLRVAVVGVGGIGSPVATLLARTGVKELILIDGDKLEFSNMNRVRGYVGEDVGQFKAQRLANFIHKMNLGVSVIAMNNFLSESPEAIDAVATCDVVFGCTDDVSGRDILNQCLYYYCQAFIDSGIAGSVGKDLEGGPRLSTQKGRVSCILPEAGACLRCQNVVNEQKLHNEEFFKQNPHLKKIDPLVLEKDYYIQGAGVQSPGIGPFTSATADNAVATLMNLIAPFRNLSDELRQDNIWTDFLHMTIHSNAPRDHADCPYCRTKSLLLKRERTYRLDTPAFGKIVSS